jgi:hypothetical protein
MEETTRFWQTLHRLTVFDEKLVKAGFGLDPTGASAALPGAPGFWSSVRCERVIVHHAG